MTIEQFIEKLKELENLPPLEGFDDLLLPQQELYYDICVDINSFLSDWKTLQKNIDEKGGKYLDITKEVEEEFGKKLNTIIFPEGYDDNYIDGEFMISSGLVTALDYTQLSYDPLTYITIHGKQYIDNGLDTVYVDDTSVDVPTLIRVNIIDGKLF